MSHGCIKVGAEFTVSKTDNRFIEVEFNFDNKDIWKGCFPIYYPHLSLDYSLPESKEKLASDLKSAYEQLSPNNIAESIISAKRRWGRKVDSVTYKVFEVLLTGKWECRACGVGKINDQAAARIRDIKKNGYIVATKTMQCMKCKQSQYHDILIPIKIESDVRSEFRKPISKKMKERILQVLGMRDVFFNSTRPVNEFVIDHKFPSQRWVREETDNSNLTDDDIRDKFQLLTNQSNMLKSRLCDSCCRTGKRPDFLGVKWFYSGGEDWIESNEPGSGCFGCPWYDLDRWKNEVCKKLKN